ncbi:MAG: adenine nucleotide alpha hydrolase [Chloracidobacterium sp.]|nr:adenine nucleotide alpha hydrolase [Chloracidobacterium sp.]
MNLNGKRKRVLLSWSSGKDSAWALHLLRQQPDLEVAGLLTTINERFDRVAMHAVRTDLLRRQAESLGLPLRLISLPFPCDNASYEERMRAALNAALSDGIESIAFGDLFLADVRQYRERMLEETGITPLFPLWGRPTNDLAREMIAGGLRAQITCIDPRCLPAALAGKEYNNDFLNAVPDEIDPCGENGEFHSFAFNGPMFNWPVEFAIGETVERDGFIFTDLL